MTTRKNTILVAVAALLFAGLISGGAWAQHQPHGGQPPAPQGGAGQRPVPQHDMSPDMAAMAREPHHLLAMAYHESMAAFARALQIGAEGTSSLDGAFARDAVAEIRRSFDLMERRHQSHMETMSGATRAQMEALMKDMEPRHARIKEHLVALERETAVSNPDPKVILEHARALLDQLSELSKTHGEPSSHEHKE